LTAAPENPIGARPLLLAGAMTLVSMAAIFALLSALGPDWSRYAAATCTATRCFCETPRIGALIVQPANSWSSYGYAFAGFLMIALARSPGWASAMHQHAATLLGVTAVFVGLGSALLHATLTLWGQFFDVMGMYLVSGFLLVSAVARWRGLSARHATWLYLVIVGGLLVVLYLVPEVRRSLFGVVLLAAIIAEMGFARVRRAAVKTGYYLAGIATNAVAFAIWNLDQHGIVCAPDSLWQGHAIWHLLGALSLWLTFLYFRSERPDTA
jgi:Ceramidase